MWTVEHSEPATLKSILMDVWFGVDDSLADLSLSLTLSSDQKTND
jgi:hypothetical protein